MTPTFCWVFLLTLVGRTVSTPQPIVVDACALICNPGAETEDERERDKTLYPRYPKVDCKLQSDSEQHQALVIVSYCLKLCNMELSVKDEINCFALRSSLGANLGCYCEALTPLSPNTMRLHESWRLNYLVKELANDIITDISLSPLDMEVICELHNELLSTVTRPTGPRFNICFENKTSEADTSERESRTARRVWDLQDEALNSPKIKQLTKLQDEEDEDYLNIKEKIKSKREALNNTPSKKLVESEDTKDKDQNMEDDIKKKENEKEKIETKTEIKETNVGTNIKTNTETNMETNTKTNTETKTEINTETKTETSIKTNTKTNTKIKNEWLGRNVGENHEEKELCEKNNIKEGRDKDDDWEKCRLDSV